MSDYQSSSGGGVDDSHAGLSFEKQYMDEHARDMCVEEYIQNIDQRVNLKVAQAIKQAMSLVVGKIDSLMDQKLSARFQLESGKNIALEQRITNRLHDLIKGELAVKIIEQDIRNDSIYEKKRPMQAPLTVQQNCIQIQVEQQQTPPERNLTPKKKIETPQTKNETPQKNTETQKKTENIFQKKQMSIPKPTSGLKAPTTNTTSVTNNLKVPTQKEVKPLKSILKSPKVGNQPQAKIFSEMTTQSSYDSSRNAPSGSSPSPSVSYKNRRNELKMAKAKGTNKIEQATKPTSKFEFARNAYKVKQAESALNQTTQPLRQDTLRKSVVTRSSLLSQNSKCESPCHQTPRSILKNRNNAEQRRLERTATPKNNQSNPFAAATTKTMSHSPDDTRSRHSNVSRYSSMSLTPTKQSSRFDNIPIGKELILRKNETTDKKKLKWSGDFKPVSTAIDRVDEIYKEQDPIGVSIQMRKDRGAVVTTVLRDTYSNNGRFYFKLSVKEPLQQINDDETVSDDFNSKMLAIEQRDSYTIEDHDREAPIANHDFSFSVVETKHTSLEDKLKALKQSIVDIESTDTFVAKQQSFINQ